VGDYRVIYAIDESENTILILKIGDRKSVYRQHL
jgi:mRNA-degrading endonuclease RelE of RelBE toxin-antitoxin system